jgi:hypothetical protein
LKLSSEELFLQNFLRGSTSGDLEKLEQRSLFRLFRRHRLIHLSGELTQYLDPDIKTDWEQAIQRAKIKSLLQLSALDQLMKSFCDEGIGAIPLKGPVMAHQIYGDLKQRYSRDLDLLVNPDKIHRAMEVAREQGYELHKPGRELSKKEWTQYFRYQYDVGMYNAKLQVYLELHTRLLYPDMFTSEEEQSFTSDLTNVRIAGTDVKAMDQHSTLLYLVIHGAHHLYFRLFWLRDVAEAFKRWDLDHLAILSRARQLRIERILGTSLLLIQRYFDVPVPEVYTEYLIKERKWLNRMERYAVSAIHGPGIPTLRGRIRRLSYFLIWRHGLKHRSETLSNMIHRWLIRHFI